MESVEALRLPCNLPALCFRLLDFPTLIVHHVSPLEAENLRQKLFLGDNKSAIGGLKDRHGNFQFQKGKSCLFKAHIDTLLVQLQSVPLYTMLMDLWPAKPIFLGSTFIPLKKAINQISADVLQKGVEVPSFYRDNGNFELFNLMGSSIAKARIGYRLLSLGGSLIPHVPPEALLSKDSLQTSKEDEQGIKGAVEKILPLIDGNVPQAETNGTRYSRAEGDENGTVGKCADKHSVETQTNLHVGKVRDCRISDYERQQDKDEVLITNTVCPPPLYFNLLSSHSQVQNDRSNSTKREVGMRTGIGNGTMQQSDCADNSGDVDLVCYEPGMLQEGSSVRVTSVSVQTERGFPGGLPSGSTVPESGRDNGDLHGLFRIAGITSEGQLPILNALLQEIMYIAESQKDLTQSREACTSNHKKHIIPKCQLRAGGGRIPESKAFCKVSPGNVPVKLENAPKQENSEKRRLIRSEKKLSTSVIGLSNKKVRFKKTNLTYGTTRTQRMRLEINQKDKLPERRRPCEYAAPAQKNAIEKEALKQLDLGKTYRIGSAKRERATVSKHRADAWVQTQQLPAEVQQLEEKGELKNRLIINAVAIKWD